MKPLYGKRWSATLHILTSLVVGSAALSAHATDLLDVWHAAQGNDPEVAMATAAHQAGQAKQAQANALWRPSVIVSGNAGWTNMQTSTSGANFSAPGFGTSDGVNFNTSINRGSALGWGVTLQQPIINPVRRARAAQLSLGAEAAELQWQLAQQDMMLQTTQRYFNVVVATRRLQLLRQQLKAVQKAAVEAQDRFQIGDAPITGVHEATARAEGLKAQTLAADDQLISATHVLRDATGIEQLGAGSLLAPKGVIAPKDLQGLAYWQDLALTQNPSLRMQEIQAQVAAKETQSLRAATDFTVDLVAQANQQRMHGEGDFGTTTNNTRQYLIGVQLNVPLYTGGMQSAKYDEAFGLQQKAQAEVARTRQQVRQQVEAIWLEVRSSDARLQALTAAHKSATSRLEATRLGRQIGDRTTLDLLNAENDASGAELNLLQAQIDVLLNQLRLHALVGQLSEAHLAQLNQQLSK